MIKVKDKIAHPLGISKVIKGDIRERVDMTTGASLGKGDGHVLYEVSESKGRP